ncbi:MFS transporter, partial [Salmonella enterica]
MPALTQHSTSITLFRISAAMFLNYLTIGIPLVMLPLYVQQQLHLSDLLIGIAVGSQFIATLLTRGAAGRKADTSGGRRTVITGQFYCAASGLLMLVSLIAHPVPLLAWAILIVGRVLLGIGESFILTGNLTWGMWLAGSTHAGQVISWNGMATYGALAIGAPLGLSLYARAGLALPALLVVLLPIIASGVIYGIPGNIPTARPRVPVLRVVGLVWRPGTGLVLQGIGFATLSAFTALWFNERHWDNTGFAMTLFGIAFIAVRFFCAKFPDRYGGATVATFSLLVEGTGLAVMWAAPSAGAALIGAAITGCGCS